MRVVVELGVKVDGGWCSYGLSRTRASLPRDVVQHRYKRASYGRFLGGKGSKRENRKSENRKSKIYSLLKYFDLLATYTKNLSNILIQFNL